MPNPVAPTPPLESLLGELSAVVGDEVLRMAANSPKDSLQKIPNCLRGRLATIDRESHDPPREVVDCNREPPAKWPDLRQGEGEPGDPEAQGGGDGGQIHMPKLLGLFRAHNTRRRLRNFPRLGPPCIALHPSNRRGPEVEASPGEDLRGSHLSKGRAENLETPYDVGDEVGKSVHRFGQADESIRTLLIEPAHPGGNRKGGHQEDSSGLGEGPASGGAKFEDRQSRRGGIMRPPVRLDVIHSSILDADFFSEEVDFLLQPILFRLLSKLGAQALGSPAMGMSQRDSGERDNLDNRRADPRRPVSGQRKRTELRGAEHDQPPEGIRG
jgi:hypothetical protein